MSAAFRKKLFQSLLVACLLAIAAFLLYRNLSAYDFDELQRSLLDLPQQSLGMAVLWAAASYLCLTGFDYLALRYAGRPLPYRIAALASFTSLSIGHSLGVAFLSSGAIRYRFYSQHGLGAEDVAKVILFCGVTVGLGLVLLGAVALMFQPEASARLLGVTPGMAIALSLGAATVPVGYLLLAAFVRRKITVWKISFEMPPTRLALLQLVIGPLNFACVAACLYSVMNAVSEVTYPAVATVYVLGNVASLISHVPGGLGVLESVVLYLAPGANVIAALLAFRFIYFLLPLGIGASLFAFIEIRLRAAPKAEAQAE